MKVLHLYPENDPLIVRHVKMLESGYSDESPDIIHVHGCWQYNVVKKAMQAHRKGGRIVFSPHGGLEPWIFNKRKLDEKLGKSILWQRRLAEFSYVIIAHGNMEAEALKDLGWNPRIEIIRNAVITNTITPEAMAAHTQDIYRKVMDSNTLALMSDDTKTMMSLLLKAGITGDKRWISEALPTIDETEWRKLLVYADHENVRTVVDLGARVLGVHHPYIETSQIKSYLPTSYKLPKVSAHDVIGIVAEMRREPLTLRHFVALDQALRRDNVDDDRLTDTLDENNQLKYFRRLLCILTELTRLDEGFWPDVPIDDRGTQALRNQLNKHLRI